MQYDYAELEVPGMPHPLLLSSRPGFVSGAGKEGIKAFCAYFRRAGVAAAAVLMTTSEMRLTFGGILFDHYQKVGFRIIHCPIEDFSVPENMEAFDGCLDEILEALQHGSVLSIAPRASDGPGSPLPVCSYEAGWSGGQRLPGCGKFVPGRPRPTSRRILSPAMRSICGVEYLRR